MDAIKIDFPAGVTAAANATPAATYGLATEVLQLEAVKLQARETTDHDQLIIAQDYKDIEYMTRKLIQEYKKSGLNVNMNKTKYMVIGGVNGDLILEEGMGTITATEEYKYLGVKITNDGKQDKEIRSRINSGKTTISLLNAILWDKHITTDNKIRIFKTIVRSIITYGSEVWTTKWQKCAVPQSLYITLHTQREAAYNA
ncbi:uncharacterized protein LOC124722510 [Schistocerca piceifrons]|uniref:uncharacterized protein LOC124722510 n=1 Tax=Schistocerca piceifrons TaxID=274613 RepID=UPI001F5E6C10|nr:uncharacterized protein LOC124722510 [Schistocerca piceifrons]